MSEPAVLLLLSRIIVFKTSRLLGGNKIHRIPLFSWSMEIMLILVGAGSFK